MFISEHSRNVLSAQEPHHKNHGTMPHSATATVMRRGGPVHQSPQCPHGWRPSSWSRSWRWWRLIRAGKLAAAREMQSAEAGPLADRLTACAVGPGAAGVRQLRGGGHAGGRPRPGALHSECTLPTGNVLPVVRQIEASGGKGHRSRSMPAALGRRGAATGPTRILD